LKPNLQFLDAYADSYLKTVQGKGVFLAGIVLGYMARQQVGNASEANNSPLFKQINFGRTTMRELKKHISRLPELIKAYHINKGTAHRLQQLANVAGEMLLMGGGQELGVDGNFAFTVSFANASEFFWGKIYNKEDVPVDEIADVESEDMDSDNGK